MADGGSPLRRQTSSPRIDSGSPRVAREQVVAKDEGSDSPVLRKALSMGSLREGEGGEKEEGKDKGEEGEEKAKEDVRRTVAKEAGEEKKVASGDGGNRAPHMNQGMPPGYGNAYDAGSQAAYR